MLALLISVPLAAHHGTGGTYEMGKPITLKGITTEFKFANPHVGVRFNVTGNKGSVVNWLAEGPALINWTRQGWNRNSMKVGDQVTITLFPAKSGEPDGVISKLVLGTGKEWCCQTGNTK